MGEEKRKMILDAAIKVFARKGYQYATVEEIAAEAGVSKGLVHVYYENKLDLLLSTILLFSKTVNEMCACKIPGCSDPADKLKAVFQVYQELMSSDDYYWGHIIKEGLPEPEKLKSEQQKQKHEEIGRENTRLQKTIDKLINEGQKQGRIDGSVKPQVLRQILGGSSQMLYYGLTVQQKRGRNIGYTEEEVRQSMSVLIDKFCIQP